MADFPGKGLIEAVISKNGIDVNAQNKPPVAVLGEEKYISHEGSVITFDGSKSYDPDDDPLNNFWKLTDAANCDRIYEEPSAPEEYEKAFEDFHKKHPEITDEEEMLATFVSSSEGKAATEAYEQAIANLHPKIATYLCADDVPDGMVELTVSDTLLDDTTTAALIIQNVNPTLKISRITDELGYQIGVDLDFILEKIPVYVEVCFGNVGVLDTHTVSLVWEGNFMVDLHLPENKCPLTQQHTFANPGSYAVSISITDDDLGTAADEQLLEVLNPTNAILRAIFVIEGIIATGQLSDKVEKHARSVIAYLERASEMVASSPDCAFPKDLAYGIDKMKKAIKKLETYNTTAMETFFPAIPIVVLSARSVAVGLAEYATDPELKERAEEHISQGDAFARSIPTDTVYYYHKSAKVIAYGSSRTHRRGLK